jgi:hypothetical protein
MTSSRTVEDCLSEHWNLILTRLKQWKLRKALRVGQGATGKVPRTRQGAAGKAPRPTQGAIVGPASDCNE